MNKTERVKAAIAFEKVDRIPIGLWPHFTPVDQDLEKLVDTHYTFYEEFDLDFVKLMPYGLYSVEDYGPKIKKINEPDKWAYIEEPFIQKNEDWEKIIPLDVTKGVYGMQLAYAKKMIDRMKQNNDEAPVIHTVFSPLTTLCKLVGWDLIEKSIKKQPEVVHRSLAVITDTTVNFIRENIKNGVAGFFFACQQANYKFMNDSEYDEFGEKYDRMVFDAMGEESWFRVIHIHSFTQEVEKSMFNRLINYPANCVNWHDRWVGPTLREARALTNKCLIGGINEEQYLNKVDYREIYKHVREAVELAGMEGFMLGPGCTIYEDTPLQNFYAVRMAIEKYGKK